MSLDDYIKKEDLVRVVLEQEKLSQKYDIVTDHLGHMMNLQTRYAVKVLSDEFNVTTEEKNMYKDNPPEQLELGLNYDRMQLQLFGESQQYKREAELDVMYENHMNDTWD